LSDQCNALAWSHAGVPGSARIYSILTCALPNGATLSAPHQRRPVMPQILVVTEAPAEDRAVVYRERISTSDFESAHFSGQLAERVGWAVEDADRFEREAAANPASAKSAAAAQSDVVVGPAVAEIRGHG